MIEKGARRRVVKAIELERDIQRYETRERLKGKVVLSCEAYNGLRKNLVEICCQLNAVANPEGKGRDDLGAEILIAAEGLARRVSNSRSSAVRKLAERIKRAFADLRQLFRKYDKNIDMVDPQLKNNPELVEALEGFEKSWEKGKRYFLSGKMCGMLMKFSQLIEGVAEKYKEIREKIEAADTEIFVTVPCLVVLSALDGDDKGICAAYHPAIVNPGPEHTHYESTKRKYDELRRRVHDGYELYNLVERTVMEKDTKELLAKCGVSGKEIELLVHDIKLLAIAMQRERPADWNDLMETAMGQV